MPFIGLCRFETFPVMKLDKFMQLAQEFAEKTRGKEPGAEQGKGAARKDILQEIEKLEKRIEHLERHSFVQQGDVTWAGKCHLDFRPTETNYKKAGLKVVRSGLEKIDFLFFKDILELISIRSVDMPAFNRASSRMFIKFSGRIPVRDCPFHSFAVSFLQASHSEEISLSCFFSP